MTGIRIQIDEQQGQKRLRKDEGGEQEGWYYANALTLGDSPEDVLRELRDEIEDFLEKE